MGRITYRFGGIATAHSVGHRFHRAAVDAVDRYYLLMYFRTPFLYGSVDCPERGEGGSIFCTRRKPLPITQVLRWGLSTIGCFLTAERI